jgi:cell division protein FtsL
MSEQIEKILLWVIIVYFLVLGGLEIYSIKRILKTHHVLCECLPDKYSPLYKEYCQ